MSFLNKLKRLFGFTSNGDRKLRCIDCKKNFVFDHGEQEFFKKKGFTEPKRCPVCRKQAKSRIKGKPRNQRNSSSSNSRRYRPRRRRSVIDGDSPYADE